MAAPPQQGRPRSSEVGNTMRRSFSGNPFAKPSIIANQRGAFNPSTPANSPSDRPRRHSVGRENIIVPLSDHEEKENDRDQNLKPSKLRSPASSKGTKHFMSPTISAASKINASPRKKVLGERNEPIRTSIWSFEGKSSLMEDCDSKPEKGLSQKKEVSFDTTVTYLGDSDAGEVDHEDMDVKAVESITENYADVLSSGTKHMEKDSVNLDPSFDISPRVPCSVPISALAPLDADPSMPPYDPKTNYLSPRPQFLHYRPNPRLELYLNQENEGKRLDESFTSESNSDTDVTEEEFQLESSQNETEDGSPSEVAEEEKAEIEEVKAEIEEVNDLAMTEPASISPIEIKKVSTPPFFTRRKFTFFLLLVASAYLCVSLNNSPIMEANVLNNLSFSEPYIPPEIAEFTRNTFNDITLKLQRSLNYYLSFIHDLVSGFRERHKIGPLQYANLTIVLDDSLVESGNYVFGQIRQAEIDSIEPVKEHENTAALGDSNDLEYEEDDLQYNSEVLEDQSVEELFEDEAIQEDIITESDQTLQADDDSTDEAVQEENSVQEAVEAHTLKTSDVSNFSETEELKAGPVAVVLQGRTESAASLDDTMNQNLSAPQVAAANVAQDDATAVETYESLDNALENPKKPESTVLALDDYSDISLEKISILILSVLAATAFIFIVYQRHPTKNAVLTAHQKPQTNIKDCSSMPVQAVRLCSKNWQTENAVGESCPSEMSSYQNTSAAYTSEAQSLERRPRKNYRRESLATSDCSTGSPSYGSFTTYEKIPTKHGYGDEEVITPVRRSSRIRNLVTSP